MARNPNMALNHFREDGRDGTVLKIFIVYSNTEVSCNLEVVWYIFGPVVEGKKQRCLKKASISRQAAAELNQTRMENVKEIRQES